MTLGVLGLVGRGVDKGRDDTAEVSDRDDNGSRDTLLERAAAVVRAPGDNDGNERVDAHGGKEESEVVDAVGDISEEETVAETRHDRAADDEGARRCHLSER